MQTRINPLSANRTKWSNTLKQFVINLLTSFLSVFDHFLGLALKGLREKIHVRRIVEEALPKRGRKIQDSYQRNDQVSRKEQDTKSKGEICSTLRTKNY